MKLHSNIRHINGRDCLVDSVRTFERTARKVARFRHHVRLNLCCYNSHITPKSLRLKSCPKGRFIQIWKVNVSQVTPFCQICLFRDITRCNWHISDIYMAVKVNEVLFLQLVVFFVFRFSFLQSSCDTQKKKPPQASSIKAYVVMQGFPDNVTVTGNIGNYRGCTPSIHTAWNDLRWWNFLFGNRFL